MTSKVVNSLVEILKIEGKELSSISEFLKQISEYCKADGAIVWEENQHTDHLFIVARWFTNGIEPSVNDLPINQSVTGVGIKSNRAQYVPNIHRNSLVNSLTNFWSDTDFQSFISIPIDFKDGNKGALNVYSSKLNPFDKNTQEELQILASILPHWYSSLRNRVTLNLISKIDDLIHDTKIKYSEGYNYCIQQIRNLFGNICEEISRTFQCFETSIILQNRFESSDDFVIIASTWANSDSKRQYRAQLSEGLTGWILSNKKPVRITDLLLFEKQKAIIRREYPGITWLAKGDIKSAVAQKLNIKIEEGQKLFPLGFMGTPIIAGNELLGVVRVCAALQSPFYFGSTELEILNLVSNRIGQAWNDFIQEVSKTIDEDVWEKIVDETSNLDLFVLEELDSEMPDASRIFNEVLIRLPRIVKDAELTDIRLVDSDHNELYFAATHGNKWDDNTRKKRFPLDGNKTSSAGAKVYFSGITEVLDPIKVGDAYDETFPGTIKLIVAPLMIGKTVLGVIDVRSFKERTFLASAKPAIELMGRQLALYYHLVQTVIEHRKLQDSQVQAYQDFVHQVRSPIYMASARSRKSVSTSLNSATITPSLTRNLQATSGLCNKATRVAKNIGLFSDLARRKRVQLRPEILTKQRLLKMLRENADDSCIMVNPFRNINYLIDKESFDVLDTCKISADTDMLEQSINVILDNAVKYSYDNSTIHIVGDYTKHQRFQIIFKNKGIGITKDEVIECKKRGWRGERAEAVTGEGSGIGLWIVDNIMRSHEGGALEILPSNEIGETSVKLVFQPFK